MRGIMLTVAVVGAGALVAAACDGSSASSATVAGRATRTARPAVAARGHTVDAAMTTPDNLERSYHFYVPASLPKARPVPLLLALHGGAGTGHQIETNGGYNGIAEANQFIVVYPDGTEIGGRSPLARGRVWNGGRCCGPAVTANVDDVTFLSMVIDELSKEYAIDPARVYATGHSNGAIMAYRLACELSEKIVAVGVHAGSLEVEPCEPAEPVSVIHVHGTADVSVPLEGGAGTGISGLEFNAPRDGVRTFVRADGCSNRSTTEISPENEAVTVQTWPRCRADAAVELVTVEGAPHWWTVSEGPRSGPSSKRAPYQRYDPSASIWAFLASHPRR